MNFEEILLFWFGPIENGFTTENRSQLWYGSSAETDKLIKTQYAEVLKQADQGDLLHWCETARGRLAHIILFDQFSRNIYRKSATAFSFDLKAQKLVLDGIELGHDKELQLIERSFFYMPLEHAEDVSLQNLCVEKNKELLALTEDKERVLSTIKYAEDHRDIITKFGRFPHRNEVMGRESTPAELDYLKTANRYGQ